MPRKLDEKVIKSRVKKNKAIMRDHKVALLLAMKAVAKGAEVDKTLTRQNLNLYIRAALAVTKDNAKLESLKPCEEENSDAGS